MNGGPSDVRKERVLEAKAVPEARWVGSAAKEKPGRAGDFG